MTGYEYSVSPRPCRVTTPAFTTLASWSNLLLAFQKAARGKRGREAAATFEFSLADNLLELQSELLQGRYRPGTYTHFLIHEPKRRKISAAPFRDRIVHHALHNVIGPRFERLFSDASFANRKGRGTHRAVDRFQQFARQYRYVLRCDIVKHFPSIDHAVLRSTLARCVGEPDILALIDCILSGGDGVLASEYIMHWFDGDDLLAACRPRGLPIGNVTSQFWSNCYLHPFDEFVARELQCAAYVRYVDDFALFSDSKRTLWQWKSRIVARLARLRLTLHAGSAQVGCTATGTPWLGFVVCPAHRRVKSRKVVEATRRLRARVKDLKAGKSSFDEMNAGVQGWVNHVRYANTWGLRRHVLGSLRFSGVI